MLTSARFNVSRVAVRTSILMAIFAMSVSAGCASGRLSHNLLQSPVGGQRTKVMPGSWDKVVVLRPGSRMLVTLIDGKRLEGRFETLDPGDLRLTDSAGRDFDVARSNIRQIAVRGERDDLINGVLIGAGVGLGTAATILAVAASGDGYVLASAKWAAPLLLSTVGGVIGVFVDRAHTDTQVLYVRP
jgi:hypothetical protein